MLYIEELKRGLVPPRTYAQTWPRLVPRVTFCYCYCYVISWLWIFTEYDTLVFVFNVLVVRVHIYF